MYTVEILILTAGELTLAAGFGLIGLLFYKNGYLGFRG